MKRTGARLLFCLNLIVLVCVSFYLYKRMALPHPQILQLKLNTKDAKWPLRPLCDLNGKTVPNLVTLVAPFRNQDHHDAFLAYKKAGIKMIGVSHYQEFPGKIGNPFEDTFHETNPFDYITECDAWLYCQRNPREIGFNMERSLEIVESDFANFAALLDFLNKKSMREIQDSIPKKYDFIYNMPQDNDENKCTRGWQAHCRNWTMARKCLPILCNKLQLHGLLIGRNCEEELHELGIWENITVKAFLPYSNFLTQIASSRLLFLPNIADASPRGATEAMALNVPVVMNKNIIGGHKYIKDGVSGSFFTDEHDIQECARRALLCTGAHEHFHKFWGRKNSARKLGTFLQKLFPRHSLPNEICW